MGQRILFFDGVCNLCNHFVDFLLRKDQHGVFKVASLQGSTAKVLLPKELLEDLNSVVLLDGSQVYTESTAVLMVMRALPRPWCWMSAFLVLPKVLRDAVYRAVAKHRYLIFGRRDSCRLPTKEEKARFLD
jgi:predicted DCC family thiol-disulfide oxidoreductase YuxK